MKPTEAEFNAIIDKHPDLCAWGWWEPHNAKLMNIDKNANRESLRLRFKEFSDSVAWLSNCLRTKTATRTSPNSYNLKHRAERAKNTYICNGALIAAALSLGIPVKPIKDTPNPAIGISRRCLVYLAEESG